MANQTRLTEQEWASLPITFGTHVMAQIIGTNVRFVTNHAAELGGRKFGGKWCFSKTKTAELVGLEA